MAQDLARIKGNVAKMVSMNAPESDIDAYISQEGVTLDQVRSFNLTAAPKEQPKKPQGGLLREAKIQAQGLARGVGSFPEFIEDVASIPGRTLGGVQAIAGDIVGSKEMRRQGEQVFFAPSKLNTGEQLGNVVGRAINAPTDLTAGERARQEGAAFAGQLATGGLLRGGLNVVGRALTKQAPRVAQGLQTVANSRASKFLSPSRPADLATAYGAGVGSEYARQYSNGNPLASAGGGLAAGLATGILARGGGAGLQRLASMTRPNTGVGKSLIGDIGVNTQVNPEQKFGQLSGALRKAATNAENQLNVKYRNARELSAGSTITPIGINVLRSRLKALALGTADPDQRVLHENVLSNLDSLKQSKKLTISDIAENLRRQYSRAGGNKAFAKGEGVRTLDGFIEDAISKRGFVNNLGKDAGKAWREAISFARDKFTRFDDPADIAKILTPEPGTNKLILPAQVGEMFVPAGKGSNLSNKWTTVLEAIPSGKERKFVTQTIKSGIVHNLLKRSMEATTEGFKINEKQLSDNLKELIFDPAFSKRFTKQEQDAIRKVQASLTGIYRGKLKIPQLLGAAAYAITGQGYGATRLGAEGVVGPAMANLDDIIRMLEAPVNLSRSGANTVGAIAVPMVTQQVGQTQVNTPAENPVLMPDPTEVQTTTPVAPQGRMSYSQAKQQLGVGNE